jgi:hypothetical protein
MDIDKVKLFHEEFSTDEEVLGVMVSAATTFARRRRGQKVVNKMTKIVELIEEIYKVMKIEKTGDFN